MSYQYPTATLVTDIINQFRELTATGFEARYTEQVIRTAIKDALIWADPVGEKRIITLTPTLYSDDTQPDYDVIDIAKVEVDTALRSWQLVPKGLWSLERGEAQWFHLLRTPTTSVRITAYCRPLLTNIDAQVSSAWATTYIKLHPAMIKWYAMSLVLQREVNYGAPAQNLTDETHAGNFRIQAESIKLLEMMKQDREVNPPPPDENTKSKGKSRS